jgi:hypothetical protein
MARPKNCTSIIIRNLVMMFRNIIGDYTVRSWDSAVGIVSGKARRPKDRSFSPGQVKNFLFSTSVIPAPGFTQPPIQWVPGALSPGIKRQGREAKHSSPTTVEVKKIWIYTSSPHTPSWRSALLVKHSDNFTFCGVFDKRVARQ